MNEDYDGIEVVDGGGERIGKVERTYVDDSNAPRFVEVKFGTLLPKHRLIPTAEADLADDGLLHVPYSKDTIEASPDAPKSDIVEPAELNEINAYYSAGDGTEAEQTPTATAGSTPISADQGKTRAVEDSAPDHRFEVVDESGGGLRVGDQVPAGMEAPIRNRGDTVEVPVLEEVLVKKTVVKDIIRVKKSDMIEYETVEGDVRKEDITVDDESGAVVDSKIGHAPR